MRSACPSECVDSAHFLPAPPRAAYFDPKRNVWVLSRYCDVHAALRARDLFQASPRGETFPSSEDEAMRRTIFAQARAEAADLQPGRWHMQMESEARSVFGAMDGQSTVDLVGDVALPWSIAMLMKMSKAPAIHGVEITEIAASLLYKKALGLDLDETAQPAWLRRERPLDEPVETAFEGLMAGGELAISKMMFMAMAQSMPAFLAKVWLALMLHPDQLKLLAADRSLIPLAILESLRYAGIVHSLHRKAVRSIDIGTTRIAEGDRVELRVASANFDPERFREPERFDLARAVRSNLSLGGGLHACMGAVLVRQALAATIPAFLAAQPRLIEDQHIVWMGDSTLRWPLAVWVR